MNHERQLLQNIRRWILFFIIALALSGITAFPLETEMAWLLSMMPAGRYGFRRWVEKVYAGLTATNNRYPFLAYGYDWLAFAHLVIAVAFIGPWKDPVKNIWVIQFGRIACLMIFPLAFIAGYVRHIPFAWQLIDCSFGVLGLVPLTICYNKIKQLATLQAKLQRP